MSAKMRAIIKRPDEPYGHVTNISTTLENLQKTVEGPIEVVRLVDGNVLIVNEEGKLRQLQRNFIMGKIPFHDVIVGTVIVLGARGEEFSDCTMDFKTWKWLLELWGNVK